jgi:acetyltransferase-like isoleucine patch superfamily enzyme
MLQFRQGVSPHAVRAKSRRLAARARAQAWRGFHRGIEVGKGVRIGRDCRLFLDRHAHLILQDGCTIDDGCTIAVYGDGTIELGPGSFIGHHCTLAAHDEIRVGAGAFLGELVSVRDHDHAVGSPPSSGQVIVERVAIGKAAWIGAKATVIRGSHVGDGTVVGANAVVSGELPSQAVCAGVPARVIRSYAETDSRGSEERLHPS